MLFDALKFYKGVKKMKKTKKFLICALAVATMLAATFATSVSASAYNFRGDVNNDGNINVTDVASLQGYLVGRNQSSVTRESADVNRDGKVNILDLNVLKSIVIGDDKQTLFVKGANKEFRAGQVFLNTGKFWGILQGDGNVVVYRRDGGTDTVVFATKTNYESACKDYRLVFQSDGNIVLYATPTFRGGKRQWLWNSGTNSPSGDRTASYMLSFDNNGNLQWNNKNGLLWSSNSDKNIKQAIPSTEIEQARYRVNSEYKYSTPQEAAIDFVYGYNVWAREQNAEWGGVIDYYYENGRTFYVFSHVAKGWRKGNDGGVNLNINPYNTGTSAAYVHVHGPHTCNANDYFSIIDAEIAQNENCLAFLGAPTGKIWEFDPAKDSIKRDFNPSWDPEYKASGRIICTNAPH